MKQKNVKIDTLCCILIQWLKIDKPLSGVVNQLVILAAAPHVLNKMQKRNSRTEISLKSNSFSKSNREGIDESC